MKLTPEEEIMLAGKEGQGVKKAMELLVSVGDAYDAKGMIDITFAHIMPTQMLQYPMGQYGAWLRELVEESVEGVAGFKVPTTLDPYFLDIDLGRRLGYPEPYLDEVRVSMAHDMDLYKRLGIIPAYTCSPYLIYPASKGEHLGTAESSVVLFYNTIVGAMVNRESGPTALAAAITGKTPLYGMHFPENRYGQVLVELKDDLKPANFTYADYSALGYYVGDHAIDKIPVFSGLPHNISITQLKYLATPLSVSAGLPMLHVIGVTPEALTYEAAFGGRKPQFKIDVGKKEVDNTFKDLSNAVDENVELVLIGCPHASVAEIEEIAAMLTGKRLHDRVTLVVGTFESVQSLAQEKGLVNTIEAAGGLVISGMCTACAFLRRQVPAGFKVEPVATDSAKAAHLLKNAGVQTWFGSTQQCISAAIKGKWEVN